MKGNLYTIIYAAILGMACALLLTAVNEVLMPYKVANKKADENRNVLVALNVPLDAKLKGEALVKVYEENVKENTVNDMTLFEYAPSDKGGEVVASAFMVEGPGLWGRIKGVLALESDMVTIRGLTFFEQEETPGIGGEIAANWFLDKFKGKKVVDTDGKAGVVIKAGAGSAENGVDAISGATMTCDKVEQLLNTAIVEITKGKE
jgi:Na+-transporting NADH:ubiquinone oxidoreductase subunit C